MVLPQCTLPRWMHSHILAMQAQEHQLQLQSMELQSRQETLQQQV